MKYFHVVDSLDEEFHPFVPRFTNIKTPGGCKECCTIPAGGRPRDALKVTEIPSPVGPVCFTTWGFGVVAAELLEFLGDEAAECLRLGRLADPNGQLIEGFRTFVGVERVILRGNMESEHRLCKSCGAMIYTYVPRNSPYVTAAQVASRRPIYEAESMTLLVDEATRDRIGYRWSDLLTFYDIPVLDSPRDGLPARLDLWPSPEDLAGYKPNPPKWMKPRV